MSSQTQQLLVFINSYKIAWWKIYFPCWCTNLSLILQGLHRQPFGPFQVVNAHTIRIVWTAVPAATTRRLANTFVSKWKTPLRKLYVLYKLGHNIFMLMLVFYVPFISKCYGSFFILKYWGVKATSCMYLYLVARKPIKHHIFLRKIVRVYVFMWRIVSLSVFVFLAMNTNLLFISKKSVGLLNSLNYYSRK